MSGTDPDPRRGKPIDRTQAWRPADAAPAPAPDPNLPKIPGVTLHFELARGGMGVVYSGRQDFLDRRVAVKLLSVELGGESFVQRFQREAKILAGIKHPNIVACHMAGQTDAGQSYLVMEFIDGPSLKKWITDNGPVPVKAALRTARAVGQALGHAHTLGIIHRDGKPENILLETVTSTALDVTFPFTPKVVDLGLARASEGNAALGLTSPGSVMGTPATMSPEQYDEPDSVDFRTDIYGLGCALYEMLTGQPAFRGKKLSEIVARKREPLAPDPCTENPEVPSAVGALVQSMLAPERENRPASYKELDELLASLIDALSPPAARVTRPQAFVGEETVTGSFRPTRPGGDLGENPTIVQGGAQPETKAKHGPERDGDRTMPAKPKPPESKPPESKRQPQETSGPGLLHTGEINFLAEGLGAPMGEQGGESPFRTRPPADGGAAKPPADVWSTQPPAGGSPEVSPAGAPAATPTQPSAPVAAAGRKTGSYAVVVAIAAVAAVGGWLAFGGGSGAKVDPKPDPDQPIVTDPDADKPKPPAPKPPDPKAANRKPELVLKGPSEVAPKRQFSITADAKDPDGDAAKLTYAWTFPLELAVAKSATNASLLKLELADGLPGVEFDVTCTVTDAAGAGETQMHKVRVADYPPEQPWIGLKQKKAEWQFDSGNSFAWTDVAEDGFLSCKAWRDSRWVQTSQGNESYWEWFGRLESENDRRGNEEVPFATLGVRFEMGDRGWAVVVGRNDGGKRWHIEAVAARREGEAWVLDKPADGRRKEWDAVDGADEPHLGVFVMRRNGNVLSIRIAHAVVPDTGEAKDLDPVTFDVPLADDLNEQKITFFVDKGIGRFHVKRR